MNLLEQATINVLNTWSLNGIRTENPGVWQEDGEKKIAALGVHLRRNITSYGVGLNLTTDLRWFDRIVACGLEGKSVTSMVQLGQDNGLWEQRGGNPSRDASRKWADGVLDRMLANQEANPDAVKVREPVEGIEMGDDGRWATIRRSNKQLRARMKPSIVGRAWVKEFAKGLYGEGGKERVKKVELKDCEDLDDELLREIVGGRSARRRLLPEKEENLLREEERTAEMSGLR